MAVPPANVGTSSFGDRLAALDANLSQLSVLNYVAGKFDVQPKTVIAGVALWLMSFILWGFTSDIVIMIVAHAYPLIASCEALDEMDLCKLEHWLKVWVAYAFTNLIERVLYTYLSCLPFYHLWRLAFTVWLFFPITNGAQKAYGLVVSPLLRYCRPSLDRGLDTVAAKLDGRFNSYAKFGADVKKFGADPINQGIAKAAAEYVSDAACKAAVGVFGDTTGRASDATSKAGAGVSGESPASPIRRRRVASPAPTPQRAPATPASWADHK